MAKSVNYRTPEDAITFNLINPYVVDRLRKDGDIELPPKKVAVPKDKAWNTKQMSSKLLRGLENGDSISKISKSLMDVIGNNKDSAIRNARTMVTGAENRGRLDSYKELSSQGMVMKKEWMATPDDRTRPTHIDIDGEEVEIEEEFSNGCQYPGDAKGPAEEVWMCRCSMRTHVIGFRRKDGSISYVNYDRDRTLHDEQMEIEKDRREATQKALNIKLGKTGDAYTKQEREALMKVLRDNDSLAKAVYLKYADQFEAINTQIDAGYTAYFDPSDKCVHLTPSNVANPNFREDKNAFNTHFHEYGHNIDYINGYIEDFSKGRQYVSELYRDAKGRTFEEIITSEWNKRLSSQGMWSNFERNLNIEQGGIGAYNWARDGILNWRRENGLSRDDPKFSSLWEKLKEMKDSSDDEFRNFVKENIDIFGKKEYTLYKADIEAFCKEIKDRYTLKERGDISDMFERFSVNHSGPDYPFGIGHGTDYARQEGSLAKETFAEMFAAEISQPESLAVIKQYLPESYSAFREMLGGLL